MLASETAFEMNSLNAALAAAATLVAVAFGFSALRDESPTATGKNKAIVVMTVNPDGAKRMVRINFLSGGWDGISGD